MNIFKQGKNNNKVTAGNVTSLLVDIWLEFGEVDRAGCLNGAPLYSQISFHCYILFKRTFSSTYYVFPPPNHPLRRPCHSYIPLLPGRINTLGYIQLFYEPISGNRNFSLLRWEQQQNRRREEALRPNYVSCITLTQ